MDWICLPKETIDALSGAVRPPGATSGAAMASRGVLNPAPARGRHQRAGRWSQQRGLAAAPRTLPRPAVGAPSTGFGVRGTVTAIGSNVTGWSPGDQVCALVDGGGYADEVAVPATQVMPIPASLTVIEAAAIPEVACTVYSNLAMIAGLTAGHTVLVHGAGGGIGTFAIQWASAIGARVITTAGSDVKVQHGLHLGAVVGINYRNQDFVAATMEATDHRG